MKPTTYEFTLTGVSDITFGKYCEEKKDKGETDAAREERVWRKKAHANDAGEIVLQPFALRNCIVAASKRIGMKIPGKGQKTYTARFQQGILIADAMTFLNSSGQPVKVDDLHRLPMFVRVNEKSNLRVMRIFPIVKAGWTVKAKMLVMDELLTPDVINEHLVDAGMFIGVGSLRPEMGGILGRFAIGHWDEGKEEWVSDLRKV